MNHNSIPSHSQNQILLYFPILYGAYIWGKISLTNRIETRAIEEMCLMGPINEPSIRWLVQIQFLSGVLSLTYDGANTGSFLQWIKCQKHSPEKLKKFVCRTTGSILYLICPIFKTDNLLLSHFCIHWFLRRIFFNSGWLFWWFIAVYFFNVLLTMICLMSDIRLLSVIFVGHGNTCAPEFTKSGTFY